MASDEYIHTRIVPLGLHGLFAQTYNATKHYSEPTKKKDKPRSEYASDSPEEIEECLHCTKKVCSNCIPYKRGK